MILEVHVVSHTHWDREWYLTREQFRLRLVDLIDNLLDLLDRDPSFAHYHLDGQTIVLEDYLEIRPEQADRLKQFIRAGRVLVGPWYVMPDEFLVSGEALVRNLSIGHGLAEAFGRSMPVGYLPDLFGHVAQMPQILRQLGLDNAILWRGFGGRHAEYWWEAPDDSRVLMLHLPPQGYCNATRVPLNDGQALARSMEAIEVERERSQVGHVLLMNGVDHVEPHPGIPDLVGCISAVDGYRARHSTLPAYVAAVRGALEVGAAEPLEVVRGELRGGEDYANLLPGVLSARVYLKQANARVQTLLEREVEPLSTFAWIRGDRYPHGELRYAWKTLIHNHPHDSICGCSIDAVHDENMIRFARAGQVAEALAARAAAHLANRVAPPAADRLRIVAFNTDAAAFSGIVDVTIDLPYTSAEPQRRLDPEALDFPVRFWPRDAAVIGVFDAEGVEVPFQVLGVEDAVTTVMSRYETPWQLHARRVRMVLRASLIPACGYAAFDVRIADDLSRAAPLLQPAVVCSPRRAENEHLRLTINADGTIDVEEKASGWIVRRTLTLEDVGDVGDEYNYSPPAHDIRIVSDAEPAQVEQTLRGPLRASYRIRCELQLPTAASADRQSRAAERASAPITLDVSLDAGSRHIDVEASIDNRTRDHRLRVLVPTGTRSVATARSDTAFACIERPSRRPAPAGQLMELPVSAFPFQTFVDAGDSTGGVTVMSHGLAEYEIVAAPLDRSGAGADVSVETDRLPNTIALTLIRAVGDLSRDDLVTRPSGHAGPAVSTPGAQCFGVHTFRFAIGPRATAPSVETLFGASRAFVMRPRIAVAMNPNGADPPLVSFLTIESERGVVLSAVKKADDRDSVIVRMFNPNGEPRSVRIPVAPESKAFVVDLLERRQEPLPIENGGAEIDFGPAQIRTIELTLHS